MEIRSWGVVTVRPALKPVERVLAAMHEHTSKRASLEILGELIEAGIVVSWATPPGSQRWCSLSEEWRFLDLGLTDREET